MRLTHGTGKWLLLFGTVLALGTGMTSLAASSVTIRFENGSSSTWEEDVKSPAVKVDGMDTEPEWSKSIDEWIPGKKVTATFVLNGQYTKSQCNVYGGEFISVSSKDGETTIKAGYVPVAKLGASENAGWSDTTKTRASWKKVAYASKYQVRLYQNDQWIKTLTTTSTSMDLLEYMKTGAYYYYEVRAIAKDSSEEKYLRDGEFTMSDDSVEQQLGDTDGRWIAERGGKRYRNSSGTYVTSGWQMIDGSWYYFNQNGYASTGWQYIGDKWYYLSSDAKMLTGWQQVNGKWYFLTADGSMAIGWIQSEPGKYYFLYSDGSMAASTIVDNYRVDASGLWVQ